MPVIFRSSLNRALFPLLTVLLALFACALYTHTKDLSRPQEEPQSAFTSSAIMSQSEVYEERMQEKAERVLKAFGESSPVVVVTVEMKVDMRETEVFTPDPTKRCIESEQKTEDIMCKGEDDAELMNGGVWPQPKAGKPNYKNSKKAVNYMVGQVTTKIVRKTPEIAKVTCAVFLSDKNKDRCQEVESALAVALGLEPERGDAVLATVR